MHCVLCLTFIRSAVCISSSFVSAAEECSSVSLCHQAGQQALLPSCRRLACPRPGPHACVLSEGCNQAVSERSLPLSLTFICGLVTCLLASDLRGSCFPLLVWDPGLSHETRCPRRAAPPAQPLQPSWAVRPCHPQSDPSRGKDLHLGATASFLRTSCPFLTRIWLP